MICCLDVRNSNSTNAIFGYQDYTERIKITILRSHVYFDLAKIIFKANQIAELNVSEFLKHSCQKVTMILSRQNKSLE